MSLKILSARYGNNDSWNDVSSILNDEIQNNSINILVHNDLFGDPIYGVVKILEVEYQLDDETIKKSINENDWFRIDNDFNDITKNNVVIYTYYKSPSSDYNLKFYTEQELKRNNCSSCDYIIVINGHKCDIDIPVSDNVTVLKRDNTGFDFGGHAYALDYLKRNNKNYRYYFFMNSGVIGPIIKDYDIEHTQHWSQKFIDKITNKVKLVGTTIVCLPKVDAGGLGPKVEGFFFMTDNIGLKLLLKQDTIFCNHVNKYSAIVNGEYGLSNCMFRNGYSIDCMLTMYKDIDWTDKINWGCNNNQHPSRKNSFYGKSIDPYEVIFHKWFWHNSHTVNFEVIEDYVNNIQEE